MKTIKFDIDFIDKHLDELSDKGIYLLSTKVAALRSIFLYNLLDYNLKGNRPCLFISNIEKFLMNVHSYNRVMGLINHKLLSVLEIPMTIGQSWKNYGDLTHCLEDLQIYIDHIQPKLIVIENSELLLNEGTAHINTTLLSNFMNYLFNLDTAVMLDISNFDQRSKQICEKFISGIFELYDEDNGYYQMVINKSKAIGEKKTLTFSMDSQNNITIPKSIITSSITFQECKQIVLHSSFQSIENMISEIFNNTLEYVYFNTLSDFTQLKIDYKYALIILPARIANFNGWQALSFVRHNYPFCKVLFTGSYDTPASQKVRAMKLGANKYITYPTDKITLHDTLSEMYKYEEVEQDKDIQHNIIFTSGEMVKKHKYIMLYKSTLFDIIKDYVYQQIEQALAVQFYKLPIAMHSQNKIPKEILTHEKLVFISSYYIDKKQYLMLIFKNLNYDDIAKLRNTLYSIDNISPSVINYPIEETDIDILLGWIYEP